MTAQTQARRSLSWGAALLTTSIAALVGAELHGRSARGFVPAGAATAWLVASGPAEAIRAADELGAFGRRFLVFTGRWPSLTAERSERIAHADPAVAFSEHLDDETALLVAAQSGLAREVIVVMPPGPLAERVRAVREVKGARADGGCFRAPFLAIERAFCAADAIPGGSEPFVVLVEPSYLSSPAAASDLRARLAALSADLVAIATTDPAATAAQRAAAESLLDPHTAALTRRRRD